MKTKTLTIGQIRYTNTLPVYFYFDQRRFEDQVEFVQQVPAQLNQAMAAGRIDVGPISAFSYAQHEQQYLVLPHLSVSAYRKVRSIYLFSRQPIEQLDGARIALTNTSATSVNLLKIILEKFMGFHVTYNTMEPKLSLMMEQADAALLIGDDALLAYRANKEYHVYDLADLWHQHTGYSMTFALWTVRKQAILQQEALLKEIYAAFLDSKEKSLRDLTPLVAHVKEQIGGEAADWYEYFSGLQYDFSPKHQEGLEYYFAQAAEMDLLPTAVKVKVWDLGSIAATNTLMN
ncbi:menaquinone biosynthetic enzyme MqnA/MqnD family protein [Brevibacillus massiliensis]|jgi:chorismate dehydratase|uniref:menaquinone biosynthetic enzyme MqnA/MqnD family protein n=1 Tax=Brevibacillus massiliensis TaxID=1118054 RepID=UPI000313DEA5|nr:menaquinone biosynthesis protein [Brevibacillus massiliensis]